MACTTPGFFQRRHSGTCGLRHTSECRQRRSVAVNLQNRAVNLQTTEGTGPHIRVTGAEPFNVVCFFLRSNSYQPPNAAAGALRRCRATARWVARVWSNSSSRRVVLVGGAVSSYFRVRLAWRESKAALALPSACLVSPAWTATRVRIRSTTPPTCTPPRSNLMCFAHQAALASPAALAQQRHSHHWQRAAPFLHPCVRTSRSCSCSTCSRSPSC